MCFLATDMSEPREPWFLESQQLLENICTLFRKPTPWFYHILNILQKTTPMINLFE